MRPPSGIASRALITRFRRALSAPDTSAVTGQRSGDKDVSTLMVTGMVLDIQISIFPTSSPSEISFGLRSARRAKLSIDRVSAAPRSEACFAASINSSFSLSSVRSSNSSMFPKMTLNRLLKSCATPPVICPIASSFWACASCRSSSALDASAFFFSVKSMMLPRIRSRFGSGNRINETWQGKSTPLKVLCNHSNVTISPSSALLT